MTVFFRTTGTVAGAGFFLKRHAGRDGLKRVRMPVTVAVVERPEGLVVIDTGWSRKTCAWPEDDPGRATSFLLGLDVKPEDALASQLIGCGLAPDDVRHVVATHLHIDHVGGAVDFPNAVVHTVRDEWEALARGRRPGFSGYDPSFYALAPRAVLHDLAGPPALGFPASHDLFGDGTVLLLDAGGHTRGSVAVAVKLDQGWLLHVGDAAMFREDYRDEVTSAPSLYARVMAWDLARARVTWRSVHEAERSHEARVVPSHDPEVFEALPHTREDGWKTAWERKPARAPKQPGKAQTPRKPRGDPNAGAGS